MNVSKTQSKIAAKIPDFLFAFNSPCFSDRVICLVVEEPYVAAARVLEIQKEVPSKKASCSQEIQEREAYTQESLSTFSSCINRTLSLKQEEEAQPMSEPARKKSRHLEPAGQLAMQTVTLPLPGFNRRIHVSSAILAESSIFFRNLFSNGLKESKEEEVQVYLKCDEEEVMMELLQFMYSRPITTTCSTKLLKLLILADRFLVPSCVDLCEELLHGAPLTANDAIAYVQLPESIQTSDSGRRLVDKGKELFKKMYEDVNECRSMPDLLLLPVTAMVTVVSNPELQVKRERNLLEMVLEYVQQQFPKDENKEEREMAMGQLVKHVRFPLLEAEYLLDLATKPEMKNETCSALIKEAVYFRMASTKKQYNLELAAVPKHWRYTQRKGAHEVTSIYLDVSYSDAVKLQKGESAASLPSCVEGVWLSIFLRRCEGEEPDDPHTFGLFVQHISSNNKQVPDPVPVKFKFFCKFWPSGKYQHLMSGTHKFSKLEACGFSDAFDLSCEEIMKHDSSYIRFGAISLRADVLIKEKV